VSIDASSSGPIAETPREFPGLNFELRLTKPYFDKARGLYQFDTSGFSNVLSIFAQYIAMAKVFPLLVLRLKGYAQEADSLEASLDVSNTALRRCKDHTEYVYDVANQQQRALLGHRRKLVLTGVLVGGGALILGVAAGILIGVFGV
jgi:hypothetical protein